MPALEAALAALEVLSKKDIDEVKALKKPPGAVRLVLQCVCILKGIKSVKGKDDDGKAFDDYWPASTKMVADGGFLQSLKDFDKDNMPAAVNMRLQLKPLSSDYPYANLRSHFFVIGQSDFVIGFVQHDRWIIWPVAILAQAAAMKRAMLAAWRHGSPVQVER